MDPNEDIHIDIDMNRCIDIDKDIDVNMDMGMDIGMGMDIYTHTNETHVLDVFRISLQVNIFRMPARPGRKKRHSGK